MTLFYAIAPLSVEVVFYMPGTGCCPPLGANPYEGGASSLMTTSYDLLIRPDWLQQRRKHVKIFSHEAA